jgi:hypothetical protein
MNDDRFAGVLVNIAGVRHKFCLIWYLFKKISTPIGLTRHFRVPRKGVAITNSKFRIVSPPKQKSL